MTFRRAILPLIALAVTGFTRPAQAEIEHYEIEKPHTQILFFVDHLGFSKSQGEFLDHEGTITFDTENPENSSLEIAIKTESIFMGDEKWDAHMKNEDFFNVDVYPEMTFKSTAIELTGEKTAKITGDLTLLGVTKPVTLDVTHNRSATHSFSKKYVAGFSAVASLKRSDFGMDYGLPLVGDEVEIMIEVEAIRQGDDETAETAEPAAEETSAE